MDCIKGNFIVIRQITDLLEALKDDQYASDLELFSGSTIGKHIRHIYDFYNIIVHANTNISLDYSNRVRDPLMEVSSSHARHAFHALNARLLLIDPHARIEVCTDFDIDENDCQVQVESTIGRELMYAYDHAVHHLAIVKMGIRTAFPEVEVPKTLGVASSTQNFHKDLYK